MRRCRKSLKKRKDERDNVFLLLVYIELWTMSGELYSFIVIMTRAIARSFSYR